MWTILGSLKKLLSVMDSAVYPSYNRAPAQAFELYKWIAWQRITPGTCVRRLGPWLIFVFTAVRPTFSIVPRNVSANETSSVNIQCEARGPDQPKISWYRLMTNGQKVNLNYSGSEFTITKADRNNRGFYVCEARNHAGYINTTFFINVQCTYRLLP